MGILTQKEAQNNRFTTERLCSDSLGIEKTSRKRIRNYARSVGIRVAFGEDCLLALAVRENIDINLL